MSLREFGSLVLEILCARRNQLIFVFAFAALFLFLMIGSLSFAEPGSMTYVLSVVNIVSLAVILLVLGSILYYCRESYFETDSFDTGSLETDSFE